MIDNADIKKIIIQVTKDILDKFDFKGQVQLMENEATRENFAMVSIESDRDLSMLIGKNGQNLGALEHIIRLIVSRKTSPGETRGSFVIDINDYRKSKTTQVLALAHGAAQRVISTQKAEALLPMSAYERRLVHSELASHKDIQTESIGEEPRRRVVISPLNL